MGWQWQRSRGVPCEFTAGDEGGICYRYLVYLSRSIFIELFAPLLHVQDQVQAILLAGAQKGMHTFWDFLNMHIPFAYNKSIVINPPPSNAPVHTAFISSTEG